MNREEIEKKIEEIRENGMNPEAIEEIKDIILTNDGLKFMRSKASKDEAHYEQALSIAVERITEMLSSPETATCIEEMHSAIQQLSNQAMGMGPDGMPVIVLTNLARLGWMAVWSSLASRAVEQAEEMAAEKE